jgi:hypothetical protein
MVVSLAACLALLLDISKVFGGFTEYAWPRPKVRYKKKVNVVSDAPVPTFDSNSPDSSLDDSSIEPDSVVVEAPAINSSTCLFLNDVAELRGEYHMSRSSLRGDSTITSAPARTLLLQLFNVSSSLFVNPDDDPRGENKTKQLIKKGSDQTRTLYRFEIATKEGKYRIPSTNAPVKTPSVVAAHVASPTPLSYSLLQIYI